MYEMERPRPAARQLRLRLPGAAAAYWPSTQVRSATGKTGFPVFPAPFPRSQSFP
jgi:hypothetical protein